MDRNSMYLAVDCVVLQNTNGHREVLLIKRGHSPYEGYWALPGGYVKMNERCAAAAIRELREETGIYCATPPQLIGIYDKPDRDTRGRTVSVAYAMRSTTPQQPVGGDDATDAQWVRIEDVDNLAFDHKLILTDALHRLEI
jgi:8-oxo-dGTP diphosphatase